MVDTPFSPFAPLASPRKAPGSIPPSPRCCLPLRREVTEITEPGRRGACRRLGLTNAETAYSLLPLTLHPLAPQTCSSRRGHTLHGSSHWLCPPTSHQEDRTVNKTPGSSELLSVHRPCESGLSVFSLHRVSLCSPFTHNCCSPARALLGPAPCLPPPLLPATGWRC